MQQISDYHHNNYFYFDTANPTSRGNKFYIAFMKNVPHFFYDSNVIIFVSTTEPDPVNFTVTSQLRGTEKYTAVHGVTTSVGFPAYAVSVQDSQDRDKGILVRAEADKTISVHGLNDAFLSTDGFVAISCDGMSSNTYPRYEYGILSTRQFGTAQTNSDV